MAGDPTLIRGEIEGTSEQPDVDIDVDDLFEALSNRRRRYLWRYLREQAEPVSLSDASEQIAAWEQDTCLEEITYDDRKSVYTSLYQHHAPLLDEHGLISFDKEAGTVRSRATIEQQYVVQTKFDAYELGKRVAGGGFVAIGLVSTLWVFGVGPYDRMDPVTLGSSVLITVLVIGLVYLALVTQSYRVRFLDVLSDVDPVE